MLVPPTAASVPAPSSADGWVNRNRLGIVRVEEPAATERGARLRAAPVKGAPVVRHLPEKAKVLVVAEHPSQWFYANDLATGDKGYVASWLIRSPLPDPEARPYWVATPGLGLQRLVETEYKDYDIQTGDDARSLVMAVLLANDEDPRTKGRVYINQEKLARAQNPGTWESLKDYADEYRRVLRPVLESVEIQHATDIWLPGPTYIRALKDKGIIPTRPDWKNAAIALGKGIGGFVGGLVDGFVSAIVDVFVGIWDMVKSIISLIRDVISGEALKKAEEVYDLITGLSAAELLGMLKDAVTSMASGLWSGFVRKWTQDNLFEKWYYRGEVIGNILAEVLMAVFTGGAATAAKWLPKLGKLGVKLADILGGVLKRADAMLDALPGRRKTARADADKHDSSDRAKQLPMAIAAAALLAEKHDAADAPIPVVGLALRVIKVKYRWIKKFVARPKGPGVYEIQLIASPPHTVDEKYTTGTAAGDGSDHDITEERGKAILEEFEERSAGEQASLEDLRGGVGELTEHEVWRPPAGARAKPGPHTSIKTRRVWLRNRLQLHVDQAVERFGREGMTEAQLAAAKKHPGLGSAYRGSRIDEFAKDSVMRDPDLADIITAPDFINEPDFLSAALPDWFDATTKRDWANHLDRYGKRYGRKHGKLLQH